MELKNVTYKFVTHQKKGKMLVNMSLYENMTNDVDFYFTFNFIILSVNCEMIKQSQPMLIIS